MKITHRYKMSMDLNKYLMRKKNKTLWHSSLIRSRREEIESFHIISFKLQNS